eukprot:CAMPEP_0168353266 /NCGR_PEP_ID=MMETSP0213-20121227/23140_1 /TAXON_ID=151035 /ORGANISM="Euplotes harpa, Strain FSP1.4" /LENGTH=203 /DNA_ID=CAMNT_0008364827 /DNA_START=1 /DNA_END=612 /DNA_ORIENTATION=+
MLNCRSVRKTLISKYAYMASLSFNPLMRIHTIGKSTQSLQNEDSVLVYDSPEFKDLSLVDRQVWFKHITQSPHCKKYMELIPFFLESRYRSKNFVLRMELLPHSEYLRFYTLRLSGVYEKYVPIKYLVPITKYDYYQLTARVFFKQSTILDLDMVYANISNKEAYVFDKYGTWHDKGLNHDKLSLENTFSEVTWYDEILPEKL